MPLTMVLEKVSIIVLFISNSWCLLRKYNGWVSLEHKYFVQSVHWGFDQYKLLSAYMFNYIVVHDYWNADFNFPWV